LKVFDLFLNKQNSGQNAVFYKDSCITYKTLGDKINLRSQEPVFQKPKAEGSLIIVHRSRKLDAIIDILTCLKTGFGFLNLPSNYPHERIRKIKEIAEPYAIISDESCDIFDEYRRYDEDLAYMIFTSGTTGEPKGVMVSHKNLLSFLNALQNTVPPTCADTVMLQFASFSFDASIWEIFSTLCYGGTLVLTPEDSVLLSDRLAEFIVNNNINRALLTPVVARTIVPKNLDTMKDLFIGGDAFHQSIIEDWNEKYNLWNAYGPTEATVCVVVHKFRKGDQIVLGKSLFKNKLSISDGELVIEGDQVAIGHISSNGINLYKGVYNTGDLVSLNENDDFIFRGRKDDQIKIRGGYRVSLQEVTKTIESLENIKYAYVLAYSNGDMKEMCCFFEGSQNEKELQESAIKVLPAHMVPAKFVRVEEWPLTGSDKIDRNKLLEMICDKKKTVSAFNVTELTDIWKNVLDTDEINENSNFFQLGGQSFQVLSVIQEYANSFGLSIELVDFFKNPTLAEQMIFFNERKKAC
jgi:acyl-coenzyme A synthetase/AMP-(fatty) acid ligase/acyl carrier protein